MTKRAVASHYKINHSTIDRVFERQNIPVVKLKPGPDSKPVAEEVKELVIGQRSLYPLGVTKLHQKYLHDMYTVSNNPGLLGNPEYAYIPASHIHDNPITYYEYTKAYYDLGYRKYQKSDSPPVGKCRYEACSSNLIWHIDIHFINGQQSRPFYAIIDDYSRRILAYKELRRKTAENCLCRMRKLGHTPLVSLFVSKKENFMKFYKMYSVLGLKNKLKEKKKIIKN